MPFCLPWPTLCAAWQGGLPWHQHRFFRLTWLEETQEDLQLTDLGQDHHFEPMWPLGPGANGALGSSALLGAVVTPVLSPSA